MRKLTSDVVIVGAGIIGSSTALQLARRGFKVTVIDAKASAGSGTTSYSSGICRQFYSILDSVKLSWEGYHYWKNWEEVIGIKNPPGGLVKFREPGAVILRTSKSSSFLDKCLPLMRSVGIQVEDWDYETAVDRLKHTGCDISNCFTPCRIDDPNFGIPTEDKPQGAIYAPQTGYVSDPMLAAQNLQSAAELAQVRFMFGKQVVGIEQKNGKVTGIKIDNDDVISAPIILNAAGPYSSKVNEMAFPGTDGGVENDMKFSTRPLRQEVAYCNGPLGVDVDNDGFISIDLDCGFYVRPEVGNKLLIGGIESPCDPEEWIDGDLDSELNTSLTDNWTNLVYRAALRFPSLPIPTGMNTQGIVSTYDVTPDWTPIYDKTSLRGYYLAIGTSGNQFKNAGPVGDMMATLIEACENGYDHDQTSLRYEMKKSLPGSYIDMKQFSRLRDLNATSQSVMG